jgi:hypothetical protein
VALAVVILIYLLLTALASSRLLWHDELYTFYIANAPSWSRLWEEFRLDLTPPLEYWVVRVSTELFGQSNYAVRLPSILAFLAGSLCLYRFVARWLGTWYGLLAMLVLWASPFFYYATEARPYALVIGFAGAALLLWRRATEPDRSLVSVCLLGLCVVGMMFSHMMGILYIAPFCLAELVREWRLHNLDIGIWVAFLLPCAIPFLFIDLTSRFESNSFPPAFQGSLHKIAEAYYGSLKLEALPLLLALMLAFSLTPPHAESEKRSQIGPVELALAIGFILIPGMVNLALMRTHGAYFDRYALLVEFGYALVIAFLLAGRTNSNRAAPFAASCVLFVFVCAYNLGPGLKPSVWARGRADTLASSRALEQTRPDLPLVAASGMTFFEMDHYADPGTVARLYYLTDRSLAIRYANATIFEGMPGLKKYLPIRANFSAYSDFVARHRTFLVLASPDYPEDWLLRALLAAHADVRYLGEFPGPYKDKQLYQVTVPDK